MSLPISLCMIIKNEERLIKEVLASAREVVSEIIIVDTGSTDRSIEFAKQMGAKVYQHPWEGSFSIARNHSLHYATQPWILILDGDEVLDVNTIDLFAQIDYRNPKNQAFELMVINYTTDRRLEEEAHYFWQIRLFRNHLSYRYDRNIHNQILDISTQINLSGPQIPIKILHDGYTPSVWALQKKDERLKLLIEEIQRYPLDAFAHFNLANHLKILKKYASAISHYLEVIKLLKQNHPHHINKILSGIHDQDWYQNAYYSAVFCANQLRDFELSLTLSDEFISINPLIAEIILRRTEALIELNRYQEAEALCQRFYDNRNRYASKQKTWIDLKYRYARVLYLNQKYQKAYQEILALYPITDDITIFNHIALLSVELDEILTFALSLECIVQLDPNDPDLPVIIQCFKNKNTNYAHCQSIDSLRDQLFVSLQNQQISQDQAQAHYKEMMGIFHAIKEEAPDLIELILVGDQSHTWLKYQALSPFRLYEYTENLALSNQSNRFILNLNTNSSFFGEVIYTIQDDDIDLICKKIIQNQPYPILHQHTAFINPVLDEELSLNPLMSHTLMQSHVLSLPLIHRFISKHERMKRLEEIEMYRWKARNINGFRAFYELYTVIQRVLLGE